MKYIDSDAGPRPMNNNVVLGIAIVVALGLCFAGTACLTPTGEKPHPHIMSETDVNEYYEDTITVDGIIISVSVTDQNGPAGGYNPFKVEKVDSDSYKISGTPQIIGEYSVDVTVESNMTSSIGLIQKTVTIFTIVAS